MAIDELVKFRKKMDEIPKKPKADDYGPLRRRGMVERELGLLHGLMGKIDEAVGYLEDAVTTARSCWKALEKAHDRYRQIEGIWVVREWVHLGIMVSSNDEFFDELNYFLMEIPRRLPTSDRAAGHYLKVVLPLYLWWEHGRGEMPKLPSGWGSTGFKSRFSHLWGERVDRDRMALVKALRTDELERVRPVMLKMCLAEGDLLTPADLGKMALLRLAVRHWPKKKWQKCFPGHGVIEELVSR